MGKPNIIFDTDIGNDVDDALALVLLHAFVRDGDADLGVVLVNKGNRLAPAYVDLINRFCGRTDVEIGWCSDGPTPAEGSFLRPVLDTAEGALPYDPDTKQWPDAVSLLRRHLASIPDGRGVYVSTGFSTILARFLESRPDEFSELTGVELASRKLRMVSVMAGNFDPEVLRNPMPENTEYNVVTDIPSAARAFALCPVPMVFSGFEVGMALHFPRQVVRDDMDWAEFHPLEMSYRLYCGLDHDRPLWDLTSLLYAAFPESGYFDLSEPGTVTVSESGHTAFQPNPEGRHRFLILKEDRVSEILDLFSKGCSRPFDSAFESVQSERYPSGMAQEMELAQH